MCSHRVGKGKHSVQVEVGGHLCGISSPLYVGSRKSNADHQTCTSITLIHWARKDLYFKSDLNAVIRRDGSDKQQWLSSEKMPERFVRRLVCSGSTWHHL